jgi:outer membrane receptor protein involved in Fe transport
LDLTDLDPVMREIQRPKQMGNFSLSVDHGDLTVGIQTIYQSSQGVDEIERVLGLGDSQALYGDAGFFDSVIITDVNANYRFSDQLSFFAAVNNVTDEEPYATQSAWPIGPRGRTLILGLSYSM